MKISVNKHKLENMIETIVNCNNSYLLDDLYLLTYDITCAKNKQKCCDCPFRNKESILDWLMKEEQKLWIKKNVFLFI